VLQCPTTVSLCTPALPPRARKKSLSAAAAAAVAAARSLSCCPAMAAHACMHCPPGIMSLIINRALLHGEPDWHPKQPTPQRNNDLWCCIKWTGRKNEDWLTEIVFNHCCGQGSFWLRSDPDLTCRPRRVLFLVWPKDPIFNQNTYRI
jgi:hypothetical protein